MMNCLRASYLLALDRQLAAHRCIPIIRFTSTLVKEEIKIGKKNRFARESIESITSGMDLATKKKKTRMK